MPTPYIEDLIAGVPHPGKKAIKAWAEALSDALYNYVFDPTINRTNYYVHSTGTTSGTGIQSDPISWEGIPSKLANNRRFLFAAGDEIAVGSGINAQAYDNVAFESYGDISLLGRPRIHTFNQRYNQSNSWVFHSGTTYMLTGVFPTQIGFIRERGTDSSTLVPPKFLNATSGTNGVINNNYSWTYNSGNGGILYLNIGTHPSGRDIEITRQVNMDGIQIKGNRSYVRGLRIEGFGVSLAQSLGNYAVRSFSIHDQVTAIVNCEGYYNGTHNFGHVGAGTGYFLQKDCIAGYCSRVATNYVSYSDNGNHVGVYDNCYVRFGDVPNPQNNISGTISGNLSKAFYAHCAGSNTTRLMVSNECGTIPTISGAVPAEGGIFFDNGPGVDGNHSTLRNFIIDYSANNINTGGQFGFCTKNIYINNIYKFRTIGALGAENISAAVGGAHINSIISISDQNDIGNQWRSIATYNRGGSGCLILNSHIAFNGSNSNTFFYGALQYSATIASSGMHMANSIFSRTGSRMLYVGTVNSGTHLLNNAFWQVVSINSGTAVGNLEPGYDNASTKSVTLTSEPSLDYVPISGTVLYASGALSPFGFNLEYDANWNDRSPYFRSIGPYQEDYAYQVSTVDVVKQSVTGEIIKVVRGKVSTGGINFVSRSPYSSKDSYGGMESRLTNRFDDTN